MQIGFPCRIDRRCPVDRRVSLFDDAISHTAFSSWWCNKNNRRYVKICTYDMLWLLHINMWTCIQGCKASVSERELYYTQSNTVHSVYHEPACTDSCMWNGALLIILVFISTYNVKWSYMLVLPKDYNCTLQILRNYIYLYVACKLQVKVSETLTECLRCVWDSHIFKIINRITSNLIIAKRYLLDTCSNLSYRGSPSGEIYKILTLNLSF